MAELVFSWVPDPAATSSCLRLNSVRLRLLRTQFVLRSRRLCLLVTCAIDHPTSPPSSVLETSMLRDFTHRAPASLSPSESAHFFIIIFLHRPSPLKLHALTLRIYSLPEGKDDRALEAALTREFSKYGTVFVKIRRDGHNMPFAFCQYTVSYSLLCYPTPPHPQPSLYLITLLSTYAMMIERYRCQNGHGERQGNSDPRSRVPH